MVSVRLSADDYDAFQKASQDSGASSISDFARMAMHRWIDQGPDMSHREEMRQLHGRLAFLAAEVDRLGQVVNCKGCADHPVPEAARAAQP